MMHSSAITSTVPTNNRTPVKTESEESDGAKSGSDNVTESEDEDQSAAYNEQPQASSITRSGLPKTTPDTTVTRGPATPQRDARATTTENPSARSRTTTTNNTRQPAESGTNPNSKTLIFSVFFYDTILFLYSSFCTTRSTKCRK